MLKIFVSLLKKKKSKNGCDPELQHLKFKNTQISPNVTSVKCTQRGHGYQPECFKISPTKGNKEFLNNKEK